MLNTTTQTNPFELRKPQANVLSFGAAKARQSQHAAPSASTPRFGAAGGLDFNQARAVRFASSIQIAPQLSLEQNLVQRLGSLNNDNDPKGEHRAILAEFLGRAHVSTALKPLLKLVQPDVPLAARTSAFKALSRLSDVSSYARVDIGKAAIGQYEARFEALQEFLTENLQAQHEALKSAEETGLGPDDYIDMIRRHHDDVQERFAEIGALIEAIGSADYPEGKEVLRNSYSGAVGVAEHMTRQLHALERGLISAQNRFVDKLNRRDEDDIGDIIDRIPPYAFSNLMQDTPVMVDGETMPYNEALSMYFATIQSLDLNRKIQSALAKGLTRKPDIYDLNALEMPLKLAAAGTNDGVQRLVAPGTTAVAIQNLAPFREMNYPEIKRFLGSGSSTLVRRAALQSLLYSKEEAAKEHVLDLLNPYKFFQTVGFPRSYKEFNELLGTYIQTLSVVVYRGEDFVDNLIERAGNIDADLSSRKMSLIALGYMLQKPFNREIHDIVQQKAAEALRDLSQDHLNGNSYARLGWQGDEIRLLATKLGLAAKDPQAANAALEMLLHPSSTVSNEDKESLLAVFYEALLEDHDEMRKDEPGSPDAKSPLDRKINMSDRMKHLVLDNVFRFEGAALLGAMSSPDGAEGGIDSTKMAEYVRKYEASLKPDALDRLDDVAEAKSDKDVPLTRHQRREVPDTEFIMTLKQYLDAPLRPALGKLLMDKEQEGTVWTRALSARILGLLADKGSVDTMLDVLKEPFKGREKFHRSNSHGTDSAAIDGLILRSSILSALGHIGSAKATDAMITALKDPYLGYKVVEESLAHLAPAINKGEPDIAKIQTALILLPPEQLEALVKEYFSADPKLAQAVAQKTEEAVEAAGQEPLDMIMTPLGEVPLFAPEQILMGFLAALEDPETAEIVKNSPIGEHLGYGTPDAEKVVEAIEGMSTEEFAMNAARWFPEAPGLYQAVQQKCLNALKLQGVQPDMVMTPMGPMPVFDLALQQKALLALLKKPETADVVLYSPVGELGIESHGDQDRLRKVNDALKQVISRSDNSRWQRYIRINAANTLMQFHGGPETLMRFIEETEDPNFKLHAASAFISNDYEVDPDTPLGAMIEKMKQPLLGVTDLHQEGLTGEGIDVAVVDGGYTYGKNQEGFQDRVKLPPEGTEYTEHTHPTMVTSTLAGNGVLKGVAPGATIYSQKWPSWEAGEGVDHMDTFKTLIEGKLRGENNIRVINNSWGLVTNEFLQSRDVRKRMKEFKNIVEMAEMAGIQLVFSAGNSGESPIFPGLGQMSYGLDMDKWSAEDAANLDYILDKVITVGAVNHKGSDDFRDHELAGFSSTGDFLNTKLHPTVVAPGQDMMVYSYENGQLSKELVNGTSFSGPYTSGVLTLLLSANPDLTPADLREIVTGTAVKLKNKGIELSEAEQGAGEVNPKEAVRLARQYAKEKATLARRIKGAVRGEELEVQMAVMNRLSAPISLTDMKALYAKVSAPEPAVAGPPAEG